MAHGCSCGASCQCPAGQCNCPVYTPLLRADCPIR
ncbi:hypothetical protein AN5696.2 [Aspergillus nidulans FGSC A4]|nr:hypothetical protein AN5696.2 [Aspergillus nidulans FGSC A4]|eukprot:XP_663300.1 hypothetical protein AN5696.2 [Aspergillus nidulans FGSC A4]